MACNEEVSQGGILRDFCVITVSITGLYDCRGRESIMVAWGLPEKPDIISACPADACFRTEYN